MNLNKERYANDLLGVVTSQVNPVTGGLVCLLSVGASISTGHRLNLIPFSTTMRPLNLLIVFVGYVLALALTFSLITLI